MPAAADIAGPGAVDVAAADWRRRPPFPWAAATAAVLVVALAIAAAWSALQPVRAVRAGDVAIERLELGELDAAVSVAQIAHERNPLSPEPLWELAYIEEQRGRLANAQRALRAGRAGAARERGDVAPPGPLPALDAQPARAGGERRSARPTSWIRATRPRTSDFIEATRAAGQPAVTP